MTMSFEIGEDYVSLTETDNKKFSHLIDKKLEGGALLQELLKIGINLIPENEDF